MYMKQKIKFLWLCYVIVGLVGCGDGKKGETIIDDTCMLGCPVKEEFSLKDMQVDKIEIQTLESDEGVVTVDFKANLISYTDDCKLSKNMEVFEANELKKIISESKYLKYKIFENSKLDEISTSVRPLSVEIKLTGPDSTLVFTSNRGYHALRLLNECVLIQSIYDSTRYLDWKSCSDRDGKVHRRNETKFGCDVRDVEVAIDPF